MSREQSFNIIRTVVSMGVAIAVAFIIILLVSDQPVESIRIFLLAPLSSKRYLGGSAPDLFRAFHGPDVQGQPV